MTNPIRKPVLGLLLAFWAVIGLHARAAHAGIAVAPLKQEISLRPGEEGKLSITLAYNNRNQNDAPEAVKVSVMDVQATEEGNLAFREAGALKTSASKWVSVDRGDVVLDPGKSISLECKVLPPPTALSGEYYCAIMVTLATKGQNEKGVAVQYRIASGIFVTILGRTFPKEAKITRCELAWPEPAAIAAAATQPVDPDAKPIMLLPTVKLMLQNTGQARFDGTGKLIILDDKSRTAYATAFTSKRPTVFGGDSRLFEAPITKLLPPGKYTFRVEMDYESAWAKAHQDLRIEIQPEQAQMLASLQKQQAELMPHLEATPDSLASAVPSGATRSLTITLRNTSDGPLTCKAAVPDGTSDADGWILVRPAEFTISKGGKKTLEIRVQTPTAAAIGKHSTKVVIGTSQDGSSQNQIAIPVDIDVKAER